MTNFAIANASEQCVIMSIPVKDDLSISILDNGKNVDTRIKMFQSGYRFAESFFDTFDSTKLKKCKKEMPVNSSVVKACLKSKSVEILLKCLKENPELLKEQMSEEDYSTLTSLSVEKQTEAKPKLFNDIPEGNKFSFNRTIPTTVSHHKDVKKSPRDLVVVKPTQDSPPENPEDDEIIEIPRSDFYPSPDFIENLPEFPFPPFGPYANMRNRFPSTSIVLKVEINDEMLEMFRNFGMMVLGDVLPLLQANVGNKLRRL